MVDALSNPDALLPAVKQELSDALVPWPDDYVEDLSPHAVVLLLRQLGMAAMRVWAAVMTAEDTGEDAVDVMASEVTNGLAASVMGATHALVALGVLPAEAEQAEQAAAG
ncbi:MAG: hypothetical protein ACYDEN_11350 [Acidimicrobiales bacterium]